MIPVYQPFIEQDDIESVTQALEANEISGTYGTSISRFEESFADYCGRRFGIAVSNGTAALQLALHVAGIKKGDEVLVSATTNIATALAVVHNGAIPVPVDSEPNSWNLDLNKLESLITPQTKAILPVHLYGQPVAMDRLCEIASKHRLLVIEDCAEAHGATVNQQKVGSFGVMGCFSFYANKVITTGEGGMVLTDNAEIADKLRLLRNLAFTTPRFRHEEIGFNYRMTGLQAAMGISQTRKIEAILAKKRKVAELYHKYLSSIPGIQLPTERASSRHVFWVYGVVIQPQFGIGRNELAIRLKNQGIETRDFFCPMNQQPCFQSLPGFRKTACPVSDSLWKNGLYLPSSPGLSEQEISKIAQAIQESHQPRFQAA